MKDVLLQMRAVFQYWKPSNDPVEYYLSFFDIVDMCYMSHYTLIKSLRKRFSLVLFEYSLRVRQDFYNAHKLDGYNRWARLLPSLHDPYIHKMYLEDMDKKRMSVLLGFYKSELSNISEPSILKEILKWAGITSPKKST